MNKIVKDHSARFTPTAFLFSKKSVVRLALAAKEDVEKLWDAAIELGAEDVIELDEEEGEDKEMDGIPVEVAPL